MPLFCRIRVCTREASLSRLFARSRERVLDIARMARRSDAVQDLPILSAREEIVKAVCSTRRVVLIVGETGSGKSTQVVKFLMESGACSAKFGERCVITQPRRVAVTSVCGRVCAELGCEVGDEVGYAMRFEKRVSSKTVAKFTTDGYLIRQNLDEFGVIILDEAHERSLETDVMCGLAKAQASRIRVVCMSATLDVSVYRAYFGGNVKVIRVPGRLYPINVFYCVQAQNDYVEAASETARQLHDDVTCRGDLLVFMPGQEEISAFIAALGDIDAIVLPLYAALPAEQQAKVFVAAPKGDRKIVVATTIAETSVTIPGVRHVIDPGLVKVRRFNGGFEALEVVPTSKAQAKQRAGRAGRQGPGRCYRLYPESQFFRLPDETPPEILRSDLASVVLQLKNLGIERPQDFDFVDKPPRDALLRALQTLRALQAINERGELTPKGIDLAQLPLTPLLANVVLVSLDFSSTASSKVVDAVAVLATSESLFKDQKAKLPYVDRKSDLLTEVNAYRAVVNARKGAKRSLSGARAEAGGISIYSARQAQRAADQVHDVLRRRRLRDSASKKASRDQREGEDDTIDCLVSGLCTLNAASRDVRNRCYRTFKGSHDVYIHPSSILHGRNPPPETIVFASCVTTNKRYLKGVTAFQPASLPKLAPHLFATATTEIPGGTPAAASRTSQQPHNDRFRRMR